MRRPARTSGRPKGVLGCCEHGQLWAPFPAVVVLWDPSWLEPALLLRCERRAGCEVVVRGFRELAARALAEGATLAVPVRA